jgi:23S rRNA (guanine2445-N2)-methyltransferase / 23S rRNA (guanine2069-N7)-methyltransferase
VSEPLWHFVAPAPRGLADLVAIEMRDCGALEIRERNAGVLFQGTLETGYRACLWSRAASRVLLQVGEFTAATTDEFYAGVRAIDWRAHLAPSGTIACEFTGQHPTITHSHFGALKLKDGICDQLREVTGTRPDVQPERPSVRIMAHAQGPRVSLLIDLAGEGLHRRGYRRQAGEAPLRENVAAGMLLRAGWPQRAAAAAEFLDPMCGSGTLVIEAALIAADMAPGLSREYWGFSGWGGHQAALWAQLLDEARARVRLEVMTPIRGTDADGSNLNNAAANASRAGVSPLVQFAVSSAADVRPLGTAGGLVCTNPPYGARLGDGAAAAAAHRELGRVLRDHFAGWEAVILTAAPAAARELALRTYRTHTLWNGAIECRLLRIDLDRPGVRERPGDGLRVPDPEVAQSPGARMFANRLGKNCKRLGTIARREQVSCYRLYDADMPEYSFAIDRYQEIGGTAHLYVQEYRAPHGVDPAAAARRRAEAFSVLVEVTGVEPEAIHVRVRERQRGAAQYQRMGHERQYLLIEEQGMKFQVNFTDYLDTGLFLDHRPMRARLRQAADGKRFLNLFCYTGSATVSAAAGGARQTVSVDLSNTYLDWAARNFELNALSTASNQLVSADCRTWLIEAASARALFDLIYLDPPTFSNSKRMSGVLDTQRDHEELIEQCLRLLAPEGLLVFSTNAQRFQLAAQITASAEVREITRATIGFDFERNAHIHQCFEIRHRRQ